MTAIFWGFLLRLAQVGIDAALTIVIGAVVAGILRRMIGPAGTRKLFGSGWQGLVRGWLAGMLLPVCSLGVIPVAREMRRAGVPGGTVLAFVLAAPLLNPISFLYGLTLAEPIVILSFAAASLFLSTAAGWLWDWVFAGPTADAETAALAEKADAAPVPAVGPRRLLAVLATAGRELSGRDLLFFAVGLFGSAMLAALIPFGYLQHSMMHSDITSPLLITVIAVPLFTPPLQGMMKIGLMFEHGNSLGAAFILFVLGIGTSLGTLLWLGLDFGWRRIVPWFAAYTVIILGLAYAAEPLLYDTRKGEAGHTHAFDDYSCPFPANFDSTSAIPSTQIKIEEKFGPLEQPAVYGLLGVIFVGIALRGLDRAGSIERWLTARPGQAAADGPWWNRPVPGTVLGAATLLGLVAFSIAGAYIYYPDEKECFTAMAAHRAVAFSSATAGHRDEAIRELEQWDLAVRKLEVGRYIRSFRVTAEQSKSAEDLREAIEEVRDKLLANDTPGARAAILGEVERAYSACKAAYPVP